MLTDETPTVTDAQRHSLPSLNPRRKDRPFSPREGSSQFFSLRRLLWALQNERLSLADIVEYFSYFQREAVLDAINQSIEGVPSIFYAVATNREDVVRTWIAYGANVNAIDGRYKIPLLAFAIFNSSVLREDSTTIVLLLLAHGASASTVPIRDDRTTQKQSTGAANGSVEKGEEDSPDMDQRWCNAYFRSRLEQALNTTQRYFLSRAQAYKQPSRRSLQAATKYNVTQLFSLPYCIVGQDVAIRILTERLLSHMVVPNPKPLVLLFAGNSTFSLIRLYELIYLRRAERTWQDRSWKAT